MCWRQLSKLYRTVIVLLLCLSVCLLISYVVTPEATVTFVSDDVRIGDKYAFMFLVAPKVPVFTDVAGADVFAMCGKCFITNNRGFLPLTEYDAVIVVGDERLLSEASNPAEARRKYLMETTEDCIRVKLKGCDEEPKVTSFITGRIYNLCTLCEYLHEKKRSNE